MIVEVVYHSAGEVIEAEGLRGPGPPPSIQRGEVSAPDLLLDPVFRVGVCGVLFRGRQGSCCLSDRGDHWAAGGAEGVLKISDLPLDSDVGPKMDSLDPWAMAFHGEGFLDEVAFGVDSEPDFDC